jgi:hypothetical protein
MVPIPPLAINDCENGVPVITVPSEPEGVTLIAGHIAATTREYFWDNWLPIESVAETTKGKDPACVGVPENVADEPAKVKDMPGTAPASESVKLW